ncbi:hypothetical protein IWZ03DRAFT_118115 [Phyllosticta citriasiana]|uniref:Uncharacterized protein n=1 Tax=Phyllosticta citriasiana TaxID=595635 RepID=A0ABR1KW70_9PEZI
MCGLADWGGRLWIFLSTAQSCCHTPSGRRRDIVSSARLHSTTTTSNLERKNANHFLDPNPNSTASATAMIRRSGRRVALTYAVRRIGSLLSGSEGTRGEVRRAELKRREEERRGEKRREEERRGERAAGTHSTRNASGANGIWDAVLQFGFDWL